MTFTEEDARYKWCPMTRLAAKNGAGFNRIVPAGAQCCASACAMWRWSSDVMFNPKTGKNEMTAVVHPDKFTRVFTGQAGRGYCGLAGKVDSP